MFDGHKTPEAHYVPFYATYVFRTTLSYRSVRHAVLPCEGELTQNTDENVRFLKFVSSLSGKTKSNVVMISRDNCNLNRSFGKAMDISLSGCASHFFRLGVEKLIAGEEYAVHQVQQ